MATAPEPGPLTLMAVHAHPDDEASSTGGILSKYASEGVRTVLVTCTDGELGDGPDGVKPGEAGHVESDVVATRRAELDASCKILGVSELELLGYHDSGMMGWSQNESPQSFWKADLDAAARRLVEVIERYRPAVLVTYDANGFYGHPDHIQANRVTLAALKMTDIPKKLYYPVIPASDMDRFAAIFRDSDAELPESDEEAPDFATPDEMVAARVDCARWVDQKYAALGAHGSQSDNVFFLRLGRESFAKVFSTECFVRAYDSTKAPTPEDDLFAGLR